MPTPWDGQQQALVEVGRVAAVLRYPVKSMAGEPLDRAELGWQGLRGDRRWAFTRAGADGSGFPWLTLRENPAMATYAPVISDSARPDGSPVAVTTPEGEVLDVRDPRLAARLGHGARAFKNDRGTFDSMAVSVVTAQSIASLGCLVGHELNPVRFRPNLVVDAPEGGPYPEDAWTGAVLAVGTARLRVDRPDTRCAVVDVDPSTGTCGTKVLRAIPRDRRARLGVYGTTVAPGTIAVGDAVMLLRE